jgi:tryptophan synthase alpha chain
VTGSDRIAEAFARARADGRRAALMPYLMGGFPDLETSHLIGEAYIEAGADLIELGIPFSDPLADGPVIHQAGTSALSAGATVDGVLDVAGRLAEKVPVVVMCYANQIFARGAERFLGSLASRGISGVIVPDLPVDEADELRSLADAGGVALVPLVAPTTPDDRLERIGAGARGFIYAVSQIGTTGERGSVSDVLGKVLERTMAHAEVPVAVGFGISTPEQAAAAADAGAAGVIVGSRLVRAAGEEADPVAAVGQLIRAFATALS